MQMVILNAKSEVNILLIPNHAFLVLVEPWSVLWRDGMAWPNEPDMPSKLTKYGTIRYLPYPNLGKFTWYRGHFRSVTWYRQISAQQACFWLAKWEFAFGKCRYSGILISRTLNVSHLRRFPPLNWTLYFCLQLFKPIFVSLGRGYLACLLEQNSCHLIGSGISRLSWDFRNRQ